jgi:hypothetical protein
MTLSPTAEAIRVKSCGEKPFVEVKIDRHDGEVPLKV